MFSGRTKYETKKKRNKMKKAVKVIFMIIYAISVLASIVYSYFGIFDIPNRTTTATTEEVDHFFWLLFIIWSGLAVFLFFIYTFLPIHKKYKV